MRRWVATRRASRKSSNEQQPLSSPAAPPHRRIEIPTTSNPASTRSAAATALSTPPLMPTTTRSPERGSRIAVLHAPPLAAALHRGGGERHDAADLVEGVRPAEAETHAVTRRIGTTTQRQQHVRRFART